MLFRTNSALYPPCLAVRKWSAQFTPRRAANPTINSMTTRRNFLTGCSVLAVAAALQPTHLLSTPGFCALSPFDMPGLTVFAREVGTPFRVVRAHHPTVPLRLAAARSLRTVTSPHEARDDAAREHRFSLLFSGPPDLPLTQDTYTFEHAGLGRLTLFIVPVLPREESRQYYEAIFNRCQRPVV